MLRPGPSPENRPALTVLFALEVNGTPFEVERPVVYKWTDPVRGELYRPFEVVPALAVDVAEKVFVFPGTGVREVPDRLERALAEAGIDHDIKVYPGVGHGFMNNHDPADLPLWVRALAKLSAAEYDEPSTRDARRRITAFFDRHLKAQRRPQG